jgi:hypothetical protein
LGYYDLAGGTRVPSTQFTGYGYGASGAAADQKQGAQQIKSAVSGAAFNIIQFNLVGTDPFTGAALSPYYITPVGAQPVLVIANTTGAGLSKAGVTNVTRSELADILTGKGIFAEALIPQNPVTTGLHPMKVFIREFLSGTYLTMEHNVVGTKGYSGTQEYAVVGGVGGYNCTSGTYNTGIMNPLSSARTIRGLTGTVQRVIGTGEMVNTVAANADGLGYAFWSKGNFKGKAGLKYLTVEGVDPLFETYSANPVAAGVIPGTTADTSCSGATCASYGSVTLQNVANGGYPIWSMVRFVSFAGGQAAAQAMAAAAQSAVTADQPDFVKASDMKVFRSHFAPMTVDFNNAWVGHYPANTPSNGVCNTAQLPEAGGDAGGMVYTLQAESDFCTINNSNGRTGMRF